VKLREFTHFRAPWLSAILILSIAITPCYANQFDKASTLYDQKKYKEARKLWEKAGSAVSESGAAYFRIAALYRNGFGHEKHHGRAAYWYRQSAEKGYIPAMYELGLLHHRLGDDTVRNLNSAILWWEKAALKGDGGSQMELAQLYLSASNKDILLALRFARAAAEQNFPASFLLLSKIDAQIESLAIGGAMELRAINEARYTLALASFKDFNSAWNFIVKSGIKNARIHQSVYKEYDVTLGDYNDVEAAYAAIVALRKDLLALRPRPRRLEVIHHELLPPVKNFDEAWIRQAESRSYTVELYRANSPIDSQALINEHGLTNSATYKSVFADSVVIAGVFDSYEEAQKVSEFLPQKLGLFQSRVVKFSEVKAELMKDSNDLTETKAIAQKNTAVNLSPAIEPTQETVSAKPRPIAPKPVIDNSKSSSTEPVITAEPTSQQKLPADVTQLFMQADDWLADSSNKSYTLQVATINKPSRIDSVLANLKQKYFGHPVHVFNQVTPEYYYFYVGLFENKSMAKEAVTQLNAVGSVIRNIGESKKRRCSNRAEVANTNRRGFRYCNP